MTTQGLELIPQPGEAPRLSEPIPTHSLVALDVFLSARLREWVQVEGDEVQVAGHEFRIVGWHDKALLLAHVCCLPNAAST